MAPERFHRTLKAETAAPQRAFEFETSRSARPETSRDLLCAFTSSLPEAACTARDGVTWEHVERVHKHGFIRWHDERLFVTRALAHEDVSIGYAATRKSGSSCRIFVCGPVAQQRRTRARARVGEAAASRHVRLDEDRALRSPNDRVHRIAR